MNIRQLYKFYHLVNAEVFNNELPHDCPINLARGKRDYYGRCYGVAHPYQTVEGYRISLCKKEIERDLPFTTIERSYKHILVHEMVHLMQYCLAEQEFSKVVRENELNWHSAAVFCAFGQKACDAGLLETPELLIYETYDKDTKISLLTLRDAELKLAELEQELIKC